MCYMLFPSTWGCDCRAQPCLSPLAPMQHPLTGRTKTQKLLGASGQGTVLPPLMLQDLSWDIPSITRVFIPFGGRLQTWLLGKHFWGPGPEQGKLPSRPMGCAC